MHPLIENLLGLFYPRLCLYCECELGGSSQILCVGCTYALPFVFRERPYTAKDNPAFDRMNLMVRIDSAYSCLYASEKNIVQVLIKDFKYRYNLEAGRFLAEIFARDYTAYHRALGLECDCIVPVPVYRAKERVRGFNQAEIFAERLSNSLEVPLLRHFLIKAKSTPSQTIQSRLFRMNHQEGTFLLEPVREKVPQNVLLVDDILTTGATLEKCIHVIRAAYPDCRISIATAAISVYD